ncbi:MAG: HlyC/CorC family transporter [Rhodothermales bacterium]|nr:HlyC/CorC family transporter [Rhodothermales bacterium]MBO6778521.1 HlyC/CorC family transporter [Rhodothermales bacterium]
MTLLIFYVALALGVSFMCSIMEAVLLSVSPAYVAAAKEEGSRVGHKLAEFKQDVDRPLAAILSLNTIAHTVGAAGAGAQAANVFGSAYLGIASAILTMLILVVSEIIPKTLGAIYWRGLAPSVARLLTPTMWSMWPLVKLAQGLTLLIARGKVHGTLRRDEFPALADVGVAEGVLHEEESRIMRSLLKFGELTVADVMTPRTVVFAVEAGKSASEIVDEHPNLIFSRIPVYEGEVDQVTGIALRKDILQSVAQGQGEATMGELRRPVMSVPAGMGLRPLMTRLTEGRSHMAIVVGEYGDLLGVVTLEDAIETLIGLEIMDEVDTVQDMQLFARERWEKRRARLEEMT